MLRQRGTSITGLITCIAMLGAVLAVAVPKYSQYQSRGYDLIARKNLQEAIAGEWTVAASGQGLKSCQNAECTVALPSFMLNPGVDISIRASREGKDFTASARHVDGAISFYYDSIVGIIREERPQG